MSANTERMVLDIGTGGGGLYFFKDPRPEYRVCIDLKRDFLQGMMKAISEEIRFLESGANRANVESMLNKRIDALEADILNLKESVYLFPNSIDHIDIIFPQVLLLFALLHPKANLWFELARVLKEGGTFRILTVTYNSDSYIYLNPEEPEKVFQVYDSILWLTQNVENLGLTIHDQVITQDEVNTYGTETGDGYKTATQNPEFHLLTGEKPTCFSRSLLKNER